MRWRITIVRAVAATVVAFLTLASVVTIEAALQFDGKCGGFMPFLAAAQPCTLPRYVWSSVSFTTAVLFHEFWWIGLLFAGVVFMGSAIFEHLRG